MFPSTQTLQRVCTIASDHRPRPSSPLTFLYVLSLYTGLFRGFGDLPNLSAALDMSWASLGLGESNAPVLQPFPTRLLFPVGGSEQEAREREFTFHATVAHCLPYHILLHTTRLQVLSSDIDDDGEVHHTDALVVDPEVVGDASWFGRLFLGFKAPLYDLTVAACGLAHSYFDASYSNNIVYQSTVWPEAAADHMAAYATIGKRDGFAPIVDHLAAELKETYSSSLNITTFLAILPTVHHMMCDSPSSTPIGEWARHFLNTMCTGGMAEVRGVAARCDAVYSGGAAHRASLLPGHLGAAADYLATGGESPVGVGRHLFPPPLTRLNTHTYPASYIASTNITEDSDPVTTMWLQGGLWYGAVMAALVQSRATAMGSGDVAFEVATDIVGQVMLQPKNSVRALDLVSHTPDHEMRFPVIDNETVAEWTLAYYGMSDPGMLARLRFNAERGAVVAYDRRPRKTEQGGKYATRNIANDRDLDRALRAATKFKTNVNKVAAIERDYQGCSNISLNRAIDLDTAGKSFFSATWRDVYGLGLLTDDVAQLLSGNEPHSQKLKTIVGKLGAEMDRAKKELDKMDLGDGPVLAAMRRFSARFGESADSLRMRAALAHNTDVASDNELRHIPVHGNPTLPLYTWKPAANFPDHGSLTTKDGGFKEGVAQLAATFKTSLPLYMRHVRQTHSAIPHAQGEVAASTAKRPTFGKFKFGVSVAGAVREVDLDSGDTFVCLRQRDNATPISQSDKVRDAYTNLVPAHTTGMYQVTVPATFLLTLKSHPDMTTLAPSGGARPETAEGDSGSEDSSWTATGLRRRLAQRKRRRGLPSKCGDCGRTEKKRRRAAPHGRSLCTIPQPPAPVSDVEMTESRVTLHSALQQAAVAAPGVPEASAFRPPVAPVLNHRGTTLCIAADAPAFHADDDTSHLVPRGRTSGPVTAPRPFPTASDVAEGNEFEENTGVQPLLFFPASQYGHDEYKRVYQLLEKQALLSLLANTDCTTNENWLTLIDDHIREHRDGEWMNSNLQFNSFAATLVLLAVHGCRQAQSPEMDAFCDLVRVELAMAEYHGDLVTSEHVAAMRDAALFFGEPDMVLSDAAWRVAVAMINVCLSGDVGDEALTERVCNTILPAAFNLFVPSQTLWLYCLLGANRRVKTARAASLGWDYTPSLPRAFLCHSPHMVDDATTLVHLVCDETYVPQFTHVNNVTRDPKAILGKVYEVFDAASGADSADTWQRICDPRAHMVSPSEAETRRTELGIAAERSLESVPEVFRNLHTIADNHAAVPLWKLDSDEKTLGDLYGEEHMVFIEHLVRGALVQNNCRDLFAAIMMWDALPSLFSDAPAETTDTDVMADTFATQVLDKLASLVHLRGAYETKHELHSWDVVTDVPGELPQQLALSTPATEKTGAPTLGYHPGLRAIVSGAPTHADSASYLPAPRRAGYTFFGPRAHLSDEALSSVKDMGERENCVSDGQEVLDSDFSGDSPVSFMNSAYDAMTQLYNASAYDLCPTLPVYNDACPPRKLALKWDMMAHVLRTGAQATQLVVDRMKELGSNVAIRDDYNFISAAGPTGVVSTQPLHSLQFGTTFFTNFDGESKVRNRFGGQVHTNVGGATECIPTPFLYHNLTMMQQPENANKLDILRTLAHFQQQ